MPLRDTFLVLFVFGSIPFILKHSYIGVLMWSWVSYMNPHRLTWSFAYDMPFAQTIALAFFGSLVFNREPKRLPESHLIKLWLAFIPWMFVTTYFAIWQDAAWVQFSKVFKIQLILFFAMALMCSKRRINLMVWVIFFSVRFFGIKGGFLDRHGGGHRVWGPAASFIEDNNHLATALLMVIPLGYYLILHEARHTWLKYVLGLCMVLIMFSVVGSYSRGAFVAIVAVGVFLWIKSPNKAIVGVGVLPLVPLLFLFMPDVWHDRMSFIADYETDASIQGRFNAWWYAFNMANDRLTGGGMDSYSALTFARYAPNPTDVHAAHSIYFAMLADNGWVGLAFFVGIFWWAWLIAGRVIRATRDDPDSLWAKHLMQMIQVCLVAYATGGAFLSLAYFDLPWHLVALVVLVEQHLKNEGKLPGKSGFVHKGSGARSLGPNAQAGAAMTGHVLSRLLAVRGGRHQVLMFHRVLASPDPLMPDEPTAAWFDALIRGLDRRFRIIPLLQAVRDARAGRLGGHSLSISFDDGYADNYTQALPILLRHGLPATFFIASGFLDGGCMWNDRIIETVRGLQPGRYDLSEFGVGPISIGPQTDRLALVRNLIGVLKYRPFEQRAQAVERFVELGQGVPDNLMMTPTELADMAASPGICIGAHTRNHPILARLGDDEAREEIQAGHDDIVAITGSPPALFAYPNGRAGEDYNARHAAMVRAAGFEAAVATDWGVLDRKTDLYSIPRFTPWTRNRWRFNLEIMRADLGLL